MGKTIRVVAAALMAVSVGVVAGCSPNVAGGGYESTSSEQNVGSRSSDGTYGGTSQSVGRAGGAEDNQSAPASPNGSNVPAVKGGGTGAVNNATVGPQTP